MGNELIVLMSSVVSLSQHSLNKIINLKCDGASSGVCMRLVLSSAQDRLVMCLLMGLTYLLYKFLDHRVYLDLIREEQ